MAIKKEISFKGMSLDIPSIAFDIAEGYMTEIKEIFFIEGKYAPVVRWCSSVQKDWPVPHQILCDYWRSHTAIEDFSATRMVFHKNVAPVIPYIVHLKRINYDDNYAYHFIGERATSFINLPMDYKGDLLSILNETHSSMDLFNITCLSAVAIRGQAMLCLYQDGTAQNPVLWNKFIVPLVNDTGKVTEFLICILRIPN